MCNQAFFELTSVEDVLVIAPQRDITDFNEQGFCQAESTILSELSANKPKKVVVDFSAVKYFSSLGISLLVRIHKRVAEGGGQTAICGLSKLTEAIVSSSRMEVLMKVYSDCSEARTGLKTSGT
jgi:anti-anti-sigma factor